MLGYHFYRGRPSSLMNETLNRAECLAFFQKGYTVWLSLLQGSSFLSNELHTKKGKVSRIFSKMVICWAITFTGVDLPLK